MLDSQKPLTPSQKADNLWVKLKAKAAGLKHGRLCVDLIVDGGHIVRAEVKEQRESLIAE